MSTVKTAIYRSYVAMIGFKGPVDVTEQGLEISRKKTLVDLAQDRILSEERHPVDLAEIPELHQGG
jgi:hypothetical protein